MARRRPCLGCEAASGMPPAMEIGGRFDLDAAAGQAPVGHAAGGQAAQARALEGGRVAIVPARAAAGGDGVQFGFQVGRLGGHRASPGSVRSATAGARAGTERRAVSRLCACD